MRYFPLLFLLLTACDPSTEMKPEPSCDTRRNEIQAFFARKDYAAVIPLFTAYEECFPNPEEYLIKLGLLYRANGQMDQCRETLLRQIARIDKDPVGDLHSKSLERTAVYIVMGNEADVQRELSQIDTLQLAADQLKEFHSLRAVVRKGEYLSGKHHWDFILFDD